MTDTTDPKPDPEVIAWHREQARDAERMRRTFEAATRRTARDEADQVVVLPGGLRILGKPKGWEALAARGHQEARGRSISGDEQGTAYFDPDSIAEENRVAGTETRTVAKLAPRGRSGPSIF